MRNTVFRFNHAVVMRKDYCVRKAFIDIQRISSYKRQCAASCNCSFCQSRRLQKQKRLQTDKQLKDALESFYAEARKNRQIQEQKQKEYDKTVRLLQLMNWNKKSS